MIFSIKNLLFPHYFDRHYKLFIKKYFTKQFINYHVINVCNKSISFIAIKNDLYIYMYIYMYKHT